VTNAEKLYETLRGIQEQKGYFFNNDRKLVLQLLEGLLTNKERYGYMCCPCRLGSGRREADADIICPCVYRDPMSRNMALATAASTCQKHGTRGKLPRFMCLNADRWKSCWRALLRILLR